MDDQGIFREYEHRKCSGKIVGEKKYQKKGSKDVEKKLAALSKRINDLQHQKRFAYKNSIKAKKAVHNQVNQIVKCFRARERNLLFHVDEAFISQDSSIGEELSKLLSTYARCQALYENIEDFKEHADIMSKISNILSTVNLNEKPASKSLEFISNFEQMKAEASCYGCLEGDFAKKNDTQDVPVLLSDQQQDNIMSKDYVPNHLQSYQKLKSDILNNFHDKYPKRERTESGDSFEIVDLLEAIPLQEDTDLPMDDADGSSENAKMSTVQESNPIYMAKGLENSCELSKSAKFPDIEKRIIEMQQRLENLVTSSPKFNPFQERKCNDTVGYSICEFKTMNEKSLQDFENESWLLKSPQRIDALDMNKQVVDFCSANTNDSPVDLIKKAFSPYFVNEDAKNWLVTEK